MSKELTSLQALIHLFDKICFTCDSNTCVIKNNGFCRFFENYKKIETALKALEALKECFDFEGFDEFIPNSKWFEKDFQERKELLKELTK